VSSTHIPDSLRRRVQERAARRCEYCGIAEEDAFFAHEPDHVVAEKHGGETTLANLAWACFHCNRFKGSDIASLDPSSGELTRLFHPREDDWRTHFQLVHGEIRPLTNIGRVTARLLKLNAPERVEVREILTRMGRYSALP
jgi:hypothetical protein